MYIDYALLAKCDLLGSDFIFYSNVANLAARSYVLIGGSSYFTSVGSFLYMFLVSHMGVIAFLLMRNTSFCSRWLKSTLRNSTGYSAFTSLLAAALAF